MKRNRFITFGIFVLSGVALLLTSLFVPSDFYVAVILCFVLSLVVFIPGWLDPHLNFNLRITILVVGLLFFIASMLGLLLHEDNFPVWVFCIVFAILEVINGITELNEGVIIIKEKNYVMGVLFIIDALFEIVLGVLMIIERQEALRSHVILISIDLFFEGTIKLINEYVEERRGIHN